MLPEPRGMLTARLRIFGIASLHRGGFTENRHALEATGRHVACSRCRGTFDRHAVPGEDPASRGSAGEVRATETRSRDRGGQIAGETMATVSSKTPLSLGSQTWVVIFVVLLVIATAIALYGL